MSTELYLIHTGFLEDEELFSHKLKQVSKERRERVEACRLKGDRLRSLAGGLLLEELVRQYYYSPEDLSRDEKGKLFLPGEDTFYFNLSHSGDYAACAISDCPVGVDIQQFRPVKDGLAKRFFQYQETEEIREAKGKRKEELFFRYWTAKESYIKLIGDGLKRELNSFSVCLESGRVEDVKEEQEDAYLKEYFCLEDYAITIAARNNQFSRFVKKIIYRL